MKGFIRNLVREVFSAATKAFAEEGGRALAKKLFHTEDKPIAGIGTGPQQQPKGRDG